MDAIAPVPSRLLVVDDDPSIRDAVSDYLLEHGYLVRSAEGAEECDRLLAEAPADLIILDVMMPGEDGLSLCRRLAGGRSPILMLSALDQVTDRVVGLEIGAWDYLTKPFEPRELLARVRALLRRAGAVQERSGGATFAGWRLDSEARILRDPQGRPVPLTHGDHALLAAFVARPGRMLTRDMLLDATRGMDAAPYDRAIDIAVSRLRRKLADADPHPLIETVRGVGYRFSADVRST
jgi:two-component system OmpR family response regulator